MQKSIPTFFLRLFTIYCLKTNGIKINPIPNVTLFSVFPSLTSSGHFSDPEFRKLNSKFYHTLISTSTPLGNSNFIRASIVFEEEL